MAISRICQLTCVLHRYPLAQYPYAQGTILYIDPSNLDYTIQARADLLCIYHCS